MGRVKVVVTGTGKKQASSAAPRSAAAGASSADGKVGCGRLSAQVEEWFQTGRMRLMEACEERNPSIVGDAKKAEEARQRLASLSVGQDTKGVSFAGDALHHLYFSTKFERRGVLLYWILRMACAKSAQIKESLCKPSGDRLMVSSVGGGPGTDSSGLFWGSKHFLDGVGVHCVLMDKEKSWRRNLSTLQGLMEPAVTLDFAPCDVAEGATTHSNSKAMEDLRASDLIILSYVCHETSEASRASGWVFYKALAKEAKKGAVFIFSDVMCHSRAILGEIYCVMLAELQKDTSQKDCSGKGADGQAGEEIKADALVISTTPKAIKQDKKGSAGGGKGQRPGGAVASNVSGGKELECWAIPYESEADLKSEIMILRKA